MKKRVKIPTRNNKALLELAKNVRDKHVADGDASPLKVLNWTEIDQVIDEAIVVEEKALQLKREKLNLYQQRDRKVQSVIGFIRNSRDVLTGLHRNEMKALGTWGFDVLDNRVSVSKEEPAVVEKAN